MSKNVMINAGAGVAVAAVDVGAATAAAVTMTIASPAVITDTAHGFGANQPLTLSTTGALPTGLVAGTVYYVLNPLTNSYNLSATPGGSAINTSGTQSGVHTRTAQIFEQIIQIDPASAGIISTGTAGTPATQVLTVQGITGGTPLGIAPGSTETIATGAVIGSGGVGFLGWLSTIATYLAGLLTVQFAATANLVSGAITTAMTGTTSTSLIAAPGAGLHNYITAVVVSNSHATQGTDVILQDGSGGTTLMTIPAAAAYGGAVVPLNPPLRQPTANTALFCANATSGASTKVSAVGFKAA